MSADNTFYILVYDIDNFMLTMKFFNNVDTAMQFIHSLWVAQQITKSYID
jgi:hypothetical protein